MIFRQKILIDWVALKQVHQLQAVTNNAKENKKTLGHIYKVDDLVLIVKKPYWSPGHPKYLIKYKFLKQVPP
jgi:hypothetical protein